MTFVSVCLYVCLSVCLSVCPFYCPQHNSKTKDPKVFKVGIGNDFRMSQKWRSFGVEKSRSRSISSFFTIITSTPTPMLMRIWRKQQYGVGSNSECFLVWDALQNVLQHTGPLPGGLLSFTALTLLVGSSDPYNHQDHSALHASVVLICYQWWRFLYKCEM